MKREYKFWANKYTIKNLELYTKLLKIFYFTLGINFLLVFLYLKFAMIQETIIESNIILICGVLMVLLSCIAVNDDKKANRDLLAVVISGIIHCLGTIGFIVCFEVWWLIIVYVLEVLAVVMISFRYFLPNKKARKTFGQK